MKMEKIELVRAPIDMFEHRHMQRARFATDPSRRKAHKATWTASFAEVREVAARK